MNFKIIIPLLALLLVAGCSKENIDNRTPEEIGKAVADKIIRETTFDFEYELQKPAINLQVLDYKNEFNTDKGVFYSLANILVKNDTTLNFGLDFSGAVKVFVNDKQVFEGINNNAIKVKEIAYNVFDFKNHIAAGLQKGSNKILIKLVSGSERPVVYLREETLEHETPLSGKFVNYRNEKDINNVWLNCGPFTIEKNQLTSLNKVYQPEKEIKDIYAEQNWVPTKNQILKKLVIKETNSYKRESYLEWHYANGNTMLGMLSFAEKVKGAQYKDFVQSICDYTVDNLEFFRWQFDQLHAIRGTNNRIFRSSMLDDTGAPALPYLQLFMETKNPKFKPLLDDIENYVVNEQVRLEDGTFCRPEPHKMTLWADDLFMSVPYLLRLAKLNNDEKLYDDAANQVVNFHNYLFDDEVGVYKHAWFDFKKEKSKVHWGRANGWMIWATSEALMNLPKNHEKYETIKNQFQKHVKGLIALQGKSGMWHQVLTHPESFEETSCTAMYILGIARGIKNGWIDKKYESNIVKAWNALKKNVAADGTVKDICRGTGIGYDLDFYFNRKRFDHDPRGLGSVLTAAAEMVDFIK